MILDPLGAERVPNVENRTVNAVFRAGIGDFQQM
jgi:hypothetical protein